MTDWAEKNHPRHPPKPPIIMNWTSKRECSDCKTMQPRQGGSEKFGIWVCRKCLKGEKND